MNQPWIYMCPLPFLNSVWTSGSSQITYSWSLAWRILSITLLVCEMSAIVCWFDHSLALPFFETGMKTDLFQFCGHCWVFQICWHIECTFTESSFRIEIAQLEFHLALFIVMLPKAHLTLHSSMSGSRWVITPFYLGHKDLFCILGHEDLLCILVTVVNIFCFC